MLCRFLPLVAFVWMLVLGGVLLVGIGDPHIIGDPNVSPVCLVCGGRSGYFRDVGDLVIGLLTVALAVAGLSATLSQRRGAVRGYEGPDSETWGEGLSSPGYLGRLTRAEARTFDAVEGVSYFPIEASMPPAQSPGNGRSSAHHWYAVGMHCEPRSERFPAS